MEIRKSHLDDVQRIMTLIHQAQNYFKQQNIDQWQDGYPQSLDIIEDIQKNNRANLSKDSGTMVNSS